MFFFFVCGEQTFRKEAPGYEGIAFPCRYCPNRNARVIKSNPWFTLCFIPIIPLSISGYKDVSCNNCCNNEPLEHRPDVMSMANGGGGGGGPPHYPLQQHGPPQGWVQQPPPQAGQAPMRYG